MEVLLVNPNPYLFPPTIPLGLEYLIPPLRARGPRDCLLMGV